MALNGGGSRNNDNGKGRNSIEKALGKMRKGPWTEEEDMILKEHVRMHGEGNWDTCQTVSRLMRCGKSCRLRWLNHLRPNLKKDAFSAAEEAKIVDLHDKYGTKWSLIARQLPGRTDNEIKNYWYTRMRRRKKACIPIHPNGATTHQAQDMISSLVPPVVSSPEKAQTPTNPPYVSIYDIFMTSSRKMIPFSSYNAAGSHANLGILGNKEGVAIAGLPSTDATGGSLIHATIDAAWPRESDQVDDDFQNILGTPLAMSMNDCFDKDGTMFPDHDHMPNYGGW